MVFKSSEYFEEIVMYLSILRYIFKSNSKRGLYDSNKQAEDFFGGFFNTVYSYDLHNLNDVKLNYPAIDLGDTTSRVCIQVTAQRGASKIRKTVENFLKYELYEDYDRLIIFVLTSKTNSKFEPKTENKFTFETSNDVWDADDVLADIEKLELDHLKNIRDYLSKELVTIKRLFANPDGLLKEYHSDRGSKPKDAKAFLTSLEFEDHECLLVLGYLNDLFDRLRGLGPQVRQYLFILILKSNSKFDPYGQSLFVSPKAVEDFSEISRDTSREYYDVLYDEGLVGIYEVGDQDRIITNFNMDFGDLNLFSLLKDFTTEAQLESIIVNCDFDCLDD